MLENNSRVVTDSLEGPVSKNPLSAGMNEEKIDLKASEQFIFTPSVQNLTDRAFTYLEVGYAVHLAGPSGTGKTTLALHLAAKIGRPVMLLHGDDEFTSSDLVGRNLGYRKSSVVDNYVHSVLKTDEELTTLWADNRLTEACKLGYTLVYDEFNRSRAEANNPLLSVLSERLLNLPSRRRGTSPNYVEVHPNFRAIFTSNPIEYVGAHKTQDALMNRIISIPVDHFDRQTEIEITKARSGICHEDAETIVDKARALRVLDGHGPSIRECIAVARILVHRGAHAKLNDSVFGWVCRDIFRSKTVPVGKSESSKKRGVKNAYT